MEMHYRWAGRHLENTDFPQAVERYSKHFENESVIRASCEDYRAGAEEDSDLQVKDQEEGRKVDVPVFVIYSSEYLGKRYDVNKLWEDWVIPGTEVATFGIEGNVGHFLPEEAPKIVIEKLEDWLSVRA